MKKILLLLLLFLTLFLSGCSNKLIKQMETNEIVPFTMDYVKDKSSEEFIYDVLGLIDGFDYHVDIKGYKDLTYFNCAVKITITFQSLEEDGNYHSNTLIYDNIYLGPYGTYKNIIHVDHKCRYIKDFQDIVDISDLPAVVKKHNFDKIDY